MKTQDPPTRRSENLPKVLGQVQCSHCGYAKASEIRDQDFVVMKCPKCGYAQKYAKLQWALQSSWLDYITRTAYLRDQYLQSILARRESAARLKCDAKEADRIAKLRDFWNYRDKGALGRTELGRLSLNLVRLLAARDLYNEQAEAELARVLLDAVRDTEYGFELAIARAKKFCAKNDLRSLLAFLGVLRELHPRKIPPAPPEELMEDFAPGTYRTLLQAKDRDDSSRAESIKRNWRKVLQETKAFPKKKRGRPRKGTD
jgi:hypothetical protein